MEKARYFFALPVSESPDLCRWLHDRVCPALAGVPGLSPSPAANWHLTLAYLGALDASSLHRAQAAVEALSAPGPEALNTGPLERFPDAKSAIVALSVVPEAGLLAYQEELKAALQRAGLPVDERRYRPHITLARLGRSVKEASLEARLASLNSESAPPLSVPWMGLYASEPVAPGAPSRYRVIRRWPA